MRKMNLWDDSDLTEEEELELELEEERQRKLERARKTRRRAEREAYDDYFYNQAQPSGHNRYSRQEYSPQRRAPEEDSRRFRLRRDTRDYREAPLRRRQNDYTRRIDWGRNRVPRGTNQRSSGEVIFYIILFIAVAVLFKWVILKNAGMTAVATLIVIVVFMGHLRDK